MAMQRNIDAATPIRIARSELQRPKKYAGKEAQRNPAGKRLRLSFNAAGPIRPWTGHSRNGFRTVSQQAFPIHLPRHVAS